MGKPFLSELRQLDATYRAAHTMDLSALSVAVSETLRYPLIAIGSGGSLSAAHFVCHLHQLASGQLARPVTPLDVVMMLEEPGSRRSIINSATMCFTAGGSNADINRAWRFLIDAEPRHLIALCARTASPLAKVAQRHTYTRIFDFDLPSKKDGFLATNSLLAFLVLMGRVYGPSINAGSSLPPDVWDLLPKHGDADSALHNLRGITRHIFERDYLIVLYGCGMEAAACDLESKFTEAALGAVQVSDFRNFAHGRHHWLAKRGKQSSVIAFASDRDIEIAKKTVELLPSSVPSAVFHFPGSAVAGGIGAVLIGFFLTAIAGEIRGIDPGRPGVPPFGRKLYHLGLGVRKRISPSDKPSVRRKSDVCGVPCQKVMKAHYSFCRALNAASFSGLVVDYDGTLCGPEKRFDALDSSIVRELVRLLRAAVPLGIATGRGKSVRKSLQNALPKPLWKLVTVGYYNGAECALLDDDSAPDGTDSPCKELDTIARYLLTDETITSLATVTVRKSQISVEPPTTSHLELLWGVIGAYLSRNPGSRMVQSAHSIDILAPGVTKRNVVTSMLSFYDMGQSSAVLCIGDQGRWPGNDSDLLSERYSLSVDVVSLDLRTCWNLAPSGCRGQQAALYYLTHLVASKGMFRFRRAGAGGHGR